MYIISIYKTIEGRYGPVNTICGKSGPVKYITLSQIMLLPKNNIIDTLIDWG